MAIVRQQVIDAIEEKLQAITFANGYSREVGTRRVYTARRLPQSLPTPAIILYQLAELVQPNLQERYECALPLSIAFIDTYGGRDPDVEAIEFASEIQKAMGVEFIISCTSYVSGTIDQTVRMEETGNFINAGEPLDGKIYGQIDYDVNYVRHMLDTEKV